VIFFIFIVSNVGGCLTPIGDSPLFLGYLYGIPFWWVAQHCLVIWAVGVSMLLAMFYFVDRINFARAPRDIREKETAHEEWRFDGLGNIFFLALILVAVFIREPLFVREILMLIAAAGSYFATKKSVHQSNNFDFHPIKEVAILFIGIFATMMPALDWLQRNAHAFGTPTPGLYYWGTGILSSTLDNAPTYLSFLSAAFGSFVNEQTVTQILHLVQNGGVDLTNASEPIRATYEALQKYHSVHLASGNVGVEEIEVAFLLGNNAFNNYIVAISVGSVFFGANTYIGNGPNFMVKSIAEQQKVQTPTFLGYVFKFSFPFMLPVLVAVWWVFFRR